MRDAALQEAIDKAGGTTSLAKHLEISQAAVSQWTTTPPLRVLDIEKITGVPRWRLRPDLYPDGSTEAAA